MGKWIIDIEDPYIREVQVTTQARIEKSTIPICTVDIPKSGPLNNQQHEALRLILAAPKLQDALVRLLDVIEVSKPCPEVDYAEQVLAEIGFSIGCNKN